MNLKGTVEEEILRTVSEGVEHILHDTAVSAPVNNIILKRQKWKIPTVIPEKVLNIFSTGQYVHHLSIFKGQKRGLGLKFRYSYVILCT
jgi:hypothetical protein